MGNYGTITNCSWNIKYPYENVGDDYEEEFPALSQAKSIDPVQSAADFYILYGLSNRQIVLFPTIKKNEIESVINSAIVLEISYAELEERNLRYREQQINSPAIELTKISEESNNIFTNLIDSLDDIFIQYVSAACGGELRHHKATMCLGSSSRFTAWKLWGRIYRNEGPQCLKEMQNLFLDFSNGSYGGPAWASAAKLLEDRININLAPSYRENQIVFIDRVFNLQHNTGCFLNKLEWANLRQDRPEANENFRNMTDTVLAAHSSNPPDLSVLRDRASRKVQVLFDRTIEISLDKNLLINGTIVRNN